MLDLLDVIDVKILWSRSFQQVRRVASVARGPPSTSGELSRVMAFPLSEELLRLEFGHQT